MPTYRGAFSKDFSESKVTGLDRDAYYPSRTPGKYVGKSNPIQVDVDSTRFDDIGTEGDMLKGGFSGPVSRNRK